MTKHLLVFSLAASVLSASLTTVAGIWESLGLRKSSATTALSEDQIAAGLIEALDHGVRNAVSQLGRDGGFFSDPQVRIPIPEKLKKIEKTLRKLRQDKIADEFVITMNRAAEKAVSQGAGVLVDSLKQMTLADAKSILTGSDTAATEFFRRTSEGKLYERFLPIVKTATEQAGVTGAYKNMISKSGFSAFDKLGVSLLGPESVDLDDYITRKTLDGLFLKIAEQEKLIRSNPAARTTELLQQVFGAIRK